MDMVDQPPVAQTMTIRQIKHQLSSVVHPTSRKEVRVPVEESGVAVAAVVSIVKLYFSNPFPPVAIGEIVARLSAEAQVQFITVSLAAAAIHPGDDAILATTLSVRIAYFVAGDRRRQQHGVQWYALAIALVVPGSPRPRDDVRQGTPSRSPGNVLALDAR